MEIVKGKQYYSDPGYDTLREMLVRSCELYSDKDAFLYHKDPKTKELVKVSYLDYLRDVRSLQRAFLDMGKRGKHVAILGDNSYFWALSQYAVCCGLGIAVPLDKLLPPGELIQLLNRAEVDTLVLDESFIKKFADFSEKNDPVESLKEAKHLKDCVVMSKSELKEDLPESDHIKFHDIHELIKEGRKAYLENEGDHDAITNEPSAWNNLPDFETTDLAAIMFTSGTSSNAKGVMLMHKSFVADVRALNMTCRFKKNFNFLSILPFHHAFENTCGIHTILSMGASVAICDGLRYISANFKDFSPHIITGVPTVFEMLYKRIRSEAIRKKAWGKLKFAIGFSNFLRFFSIDLRRKFFKSILDELGGNLYICIGGAASVDPDIISFFHSIGVDIFQGYGLTETAPVAAGCNTQVFSVGTVGDPLANIEIAIENEKPGEPGEILIRGDILMKGYYKDDAATKEAIDDDGWFHTGDVGVFDKDKHLIITGRIKSMIVLRSGKKVFPEEVERMINQYEVVKDSLVFGQRDKKGDVVITAKIVIDEDVLEKQQMDNSKEDEIREKIVEIISEINQSLPEFKNIKSYFYSFQDMVKTTTLKVRRGIETEKTAEMIERTRMNWHEIIGMNIDALLAEDERKELSEKK